MQDCSNQIVYQITSQRLPLRLKSSTISPKYYRRSYLTGTLTKKIPFINMYLPQKDHLLMTQMRCLIRNCNRKWCLNLLESKDFMNCKAKIGLYSWQELWHSIIERLLLGKSWRRGKDLLPSSRSQLYLIRKLRLHSLERMLSMRVVNARDQFKMNTIHPVITSSET